MRRVSAEGPEADDLAALRAENDRLRDDADSAVAAARQAEQETGRLRGTIAEMQVQLIRARQDQEAFQTWRARQRVLEVRQRVERGLRRRIGALRAR